MPLSLEQIVHNNRYRIEALLGQGGMGAVYRAWDTSLNIPVAIKENLDASPEAQKQFGREAYMLARLSHPNLPRVTDYFFMPGQGQYLVMDFVEGEDLQAMLDRLGALPEPQVLNWTAQVCDALAYLHSQPSPIIHRDIKPANIKIRPDGRAILVDFGIAKVYDPLLATTIGAKAVTPGYSPPEQYGGGTTDARSDIYALGATLYHLLTGHQPPESVQRAVGIAAMPPPRQFNEQISLAVEQAILKAIQVTTDRRFQSIDELRTALTQPTSSAVSQPPISPTVLVRPQPVPPPKPTGGQPQVKRSFPWAWLGLLGGIGAIAIILVVGILVANSLKSGARPTPTLAAALPTEIPPASTQPPATMATIPTPKRVWTYRGMTVGFIQTGPEGGWRAANSDSFKETAVQRGLNLKFYQADNKLDHQIAAFRNFIADKDVNVIILAALDTTGYDAVLQEAKAAGKVVVLEDRRIIAPEDLYATYVGSDLVEEGRKAALEMCKLLEGSAQKNVWELTGDPSASAAQDRGRGFRERMGDCGIKITKSQTANWNSDEGKQVIKAWLKETKDVQAIFAQNDDMGLGAIQALKEAGLKPGVAVKILTVDATAGAFKAMIAGDINTVVECNPLIAPQAYEAALQALNGEMLPKWIPTLEGVFYAKDAAKILPTRKY
jgi:ABC-type sugar transport system substrate-binding protein